MLTQIIDTVFFIACIVNSALFIPQIILLYKTKNSKGVSLLMFLCFNIIQAITVIHGYLHQDIYLSIGFTLSFISCGCVTGLIIFYRYRDKKVRTKHEN